MSHYFRELQKLVSEERRAREKVEAELFEAAKRSKGTEAAGVRKDDQEKKIRDLGGNSTDILHFGRFFEQAVQWSPLVRSTDVRSIRM